MKSRRSHLVLLAFALSPVTACDDFSYPSGAGGFSGGPRGSDKPDTVFPGTCAAALHDLDGAVWTVNGSARATLAGCPWPLGQTRALCEGEWTFQAHPQEKDRYIVHYGAFGSTFQALLCADRLFLVGSCALHPHLSVCNTSSPGNGASFVASETPPLAWLDVAAGAPASGGALTASGDMLVWVFPGCEWEVHLELVRVGTASLQHAAPETGLVILGAQPARAAELAEVELGLLLTSDRRMTWLPMALLLAEPELEVELAPGTWSWSIAPHPGAGREAVAAGWLEVRAGERTALNW